MTGSIKERISQWLIDKVCMPFIVKHESNVSDVVKHFEKEFDTLIKNRKDILEQRDRAYVDIVKSDVIRVLSALSTCSENASLEQILGYVNKASKFSILSPLTFAEDEWTKVAEDGTLQNNRIESVFKEPDGQIRELDALAWVTEKYVNLKDRVVHTFDLSDIITQTGIAYAYDTVADSWEPISSAAYIFNQKDYMGETYKVRAIDVYDEENQNAYIIIRKEDIPMKFFSRFLQIDIRKDATANDKFKKYAEEDLKVIIENDFKKFFFSE